MGFTKWQFKYFFVTVIGLILVVGFQNCSGGMNSSNSQLSQTTSESSDGLDTAQPNQKPVINCSLVSQQRNGVYMIVSTLNDQFSAERFNEDDTIQLDCSGTTDESGFENLVVEIDSNYDSSSPDFRPLTSNSLSLNSGIFPMAIRVTDPDNETTIKTFNVVVECNDTTAQSPSLDSPADAVTVVEGSEVGLWNYSVNPSAVSGGTGFLYAWDFNGDGVFDPFENNRRGSKQIWSASTSHSDIYANVQNSVKVSLQIRNSCNKITTYEIDKDLASSHPVTSSTPASPQGYYYLQGEVRDEGGSANQTEAKRKTRDYLATDNGNHTEFTCDFVGPNNGSSSLEMNTFKQFRDEDFALHGVNVNIANIPDNGQQGTFNIPVGQANISEINVDFAGESDGLDDDRHRRASTCDVSLTMIRAISTVPCSSGPARTVQSIEFYGEFSCPTLVNGGGSTLSMQNGRFYCGDAISDSCQGGGGGGGGQPPPQF